MACTDPKKAWKHGTTDSGKQKLIFKRPTGYNQSQLDEMLQMVPCGKCINCKLSYSREWATRITHEAQTSLVSCFLTLTYNDENLPEYGSLNPEHFRLFIKALRKKINRIDKHAKIKYFGCGEYGKKRKEDGVVKGFRPHLHIIILGFDFVDKYYFSKTDTGNINYRSPTLEKLWRYGYSTIGEVTYQSAAYVARYTLKKQSYKDTGKTEYEHVDTSTGEISSIEPEFIRMSQGIGKKWWSQYKIDTDKDYLNVNYQKNKIPRYYDKLLENENPEKLEEIKKQREERAIELQEKTTESQLYSKNEIKKKQNTMLIRGFENGD